MNIIPYPVDIERREGRFRLSEKTRLLLRTDDLLARAAAERFATQLRRASGFPLPLAGGSGEASAPDALLLELGETDPPGGDDGYVLDISPDAVRLRAKRPAGLHYGLQTLRQMLPAEVEIAGARLPLAGCWALPAARIVDYPRFPWRGMLLDVSRHFLPKEYILRHIDYLAENKLNVLHLHLTDSQGWRLEIERYPKLTEVGAWRADRSGIPWGEKQPEHAGEARAYGGFYTRRDMRDIIEYARERFVTVVPEIEWPGHCMAALVSYPELSCTGGPFVMPAGAGGAYYHNYCPGKDSTIEFFKNVLTEVLDLFPSPWIHIGGDEVSKDVWSRCEDCRRRMREEGLENENELQSWAVRQMDDFLVSHGRKLVGWDEILEGGLAPQATVMSWRGFEGGVRAARAGHDVVMTPSSHTYFDLYQGDPGMEPPAYSQVLLSKVFEFEPTPPELDAEAARHVIGAHCCLWGEFVETPGHAEYMTFPRLFALAEKAWSPREHRDWEDFLDRVEPHLGRLKAWGVRYAPSMYDVRFETSVDVERRGIRIEMSTESGRGEIRHTRSGAEPTADSPLCETPLLLTETETIQAASFRGGKRLGRVTSETFGLHKAVARPITLAHPWSPKQPGAGEYALVDGLRVGAHGPQGRWQGFEEVDIEAVIDLGEATEVQRVEAVFRHDPERWVFLPRRVEVSLSNDGETFRKAGCEENDASPLAPDAPVRAFEINLEAASTARYVRFVAGNQARCPEGHPAAGEKAWLFLDEIVVE